jgi:C4-dicarboxylate-binding protein DctP
MPPHNFIAKQAVDWAKLIEQNSNGELKVQVYDSAQLYRDHESIKGVQTGAIEAALVGSPWVGTQLVPAMRLWQIPFLFQTLEETLKVERSKIGAGMRETAEKKGSNYWAFSPSRLPRIRSLQRRNLSRCLPSLRG